MADKKTHGHVKEKKEEEYLRIECRMYEEKYPKINQLVMVLFYLIQYSVKSVKFLMTEHM